MPYSMNRIFETLSFYKRKKFCPSMKFKSGDSEFLFKKKKMANRFRRSAIKVREVRDEGRGQKNLRELRNLWETYFISEILYLYIMYSNCGTSFYVSLSLCYDVLDRIVREVSREE